MRARPGWALFLISFLVLYVELMLIRWIGTEIRIFAYLQNTVLVACFLGLGLGCFDCEAPVTPRQLFRPLLLLVALLSLSFPRRVLAKITHWLSTSDDFLIWQNTEVDSALKAVGLFVVGLVLTFAVMYLICAVFLPMGRLMGWLMGASPRPILAYSINVAGSLVGILAFVGLSTINQPPLVWLAIAGGTLLLFCGNPRLLPKRDVAALALLLPLGWLGGHPFHRGEIHWSPYQKLALSEVPDESTQPGAYMLTVNNTSYQALIDLRPEHVISKPHAFPAAMRGYSQYDLPCRFHPDPKSMLVVGAGTGNDVAAALRHGIDRVTAVEIDPAIILLGDRYHPERPYASSQVTVINDDARSYFATCPEQFDIIAFGLLDSHTQTAMTNARLDHYVYTVESIRHARSLLADNGVMVLSFEATKPYVADRMAALLHEAFAEDPIAFRVPSSNYGWGGVMFVAGDLSAARAQINSDPPLAAFIEQWQQAAPLALGHAARMTTDDWPYIYLESARIPVLYYCLAGLMALLLFVRARQLKMVRLLTHWTPSFTHFFCLGAAFLLLEVQNISKASVVLGSTWQVNAVIISGVLGMILLANGLAARFPKLPLGIVYFGLCGSCIALYFVDISRFAFLPYATKAVVVGALTTLPMLFSGIVFIRSFAIVESKAHALGANLLGSLVGGMLQSVTFVSGIKFLLLMVTAFYVAALLTRPRAPV